MSVAGCERARDRAQLQALAATDSRVGRRARAVLMCLDGAPVEDVARRVGAQPRTLLSWCRRWKEDGTVEDRPRPGRPRERFRRALLALAEAAADCEPFEGIDLGGVARAIGLRREEVLDAADHLASVFDYGKDIWLDAVGFYASQRMCALVLGDSFDLGGSVGLEHVLSRVSADATSYRPPHVQRTPSAFIARVRRNFPASSSGQLVVVATQRDGNYINLSMIENAHVTVAGSLEEWKVACEYELLVGCCRPLRLRREAARLVDAVQRLEWPEPGRYIVWVKGADPANVADARERMTAEVTELVLMALTKNRDLAAQFLEQR